LNPEKLRPEPTPHTDMRKVEALKKAVSEGTYVVAAEDLAPKLIESVFPNTILDEASNGASTPQSVAAGRANLQQSAEPDVPDSKVVNRQDSRSA
jgi:hypothetical protein